MVTVKVLDLKKMVDELEKEGIEYVDIQELEEQKFDGDTIPASLNFDAYDGYGGGINFEGIDHLEIDAMYKAFEDEKKERSNN